MELFLLRFAQTSTWGFIKPQWRVRTICFCLFVPLMHCYSMSSKDFAVIGETSEAPTPRKEKKGGGGEWVLGHLHLMGGLGPQYADPDFWPCQASQAWLVGFVSQLTYLILLVHWYEIRFLISYSYISGLLWLI